MKYSNDYREEKIAGAEIELKNLFKEFGTNTGYQ